MSVELPPAPPGFSVSWTPPEVEQLLGSLAWGPWDGPGTGGYCKADWRARPEHCMRVTCDLCGAHWDGKAPGYVKVGTFYGSHQRLCSKRPMSVVRESLARIEAEILREEGWAAADYLIARELDYAAREHGEYPWTFEHFMDVLVLRDKKLDRKARAA